MGQYTIGQVVYLKADSSRQGAIIEVLPPISGRDRYRVFHELGEIREYLEEQLLAVPAQDFKDHLFDALQSGNGLPLDEFQARLTASRLIDPQIDQLYSLFASRIQYIPFQFKPLLRFLRADQPRLLIADEVGVGKTIEAGLILKEMQARQRVQNVLVLCPKALVHKWREEMRRFDEDFKVLTAETLRYCLNETEMDGVWPTHYSRAIVHLELFRQVQYLEGVRARSKIVPGLKMLQPPPKFDLLIVDEAHHLRNPGTLTHELAGFLCENSQAVLFLSATPVHVGSVNLYHLLNLLRPELFTDRQVFDQIVEPNRFVTAAMRSIRTRQPEDGWQLEASRFLNAIQETAWGAEVIQSHPIYVEWQGRLSEARALLEHERIRCLRDLEEIHSLSHIINRTRRRDIGKFTIREPHTVSVPFTPQQQEFFDALIEYRKMTMLTLYKPAIVEMISITLQRQAASCLPAMIPMLDTFLRTGKFSSSSISDDVEIEAEEDALTPSILERTEALRFLAMNNSASDPKFEVLLKLISETIRSEGKKKILLFSYFIHTLTYLKEKLELLGFRIKMIYGKTPEMERQEIRSRFRAPYEDEDAIDVLLSSEVGCEGLDYEFCDRMINYDIPWNPMRIEQRIGRIDRFGQTSDKVLIYNFITPGTIEERIFFRCYERLGIFSDTIGDLEEVLGDVMEDLTNIALDTDLTPQQAEDKARQVADNLIRLVEEEHRLEEESSSLLGINQSFTADVDTLIDQGRFVSASDLIRMVEFYVALPEIGGKLTRDEKNEKLFRLRLKKESRIYLSEWFQQEGFMDRTTLAFKRWLQGGEPILTLTFDQQLALEDRKLAFITPVHPLIRTTVAHLRERTAPLVSTFSINEAQVAEGNYLFMNELWEFIGIRSEVRMVTACWSIELDQPEEILAERIIGKISDASQIKLSEENQNYESRFLKLEESLQRKREELLEKHIERNEYLINRKIAGLKAWFEIRMKKLDFEIPGIIDERILRMKAAERNNIQIDFEQKMKSFDKNRYADITTRRIAAGIVEVNHGQ
ncbi:MAG: DEAD/DEAH box helicase [Anaerolineaceae bacterium]|nr:DEAD/DEAH box helicase [Anaerolineaceae bacterium]